MKDEILAGQCPSIFYTLLKIFSAYLKISTGFIRYIYASSYLKITIELALCAIEMAMSTRTAFERDLSRVKRDVSYVKRAPPMCDKRPTIYQKRPVNTF